MSSIHRYTKRELDDATIDDLLRDADFAEIQAVKGPLPRNTTSDDLIEYAKKCRTEAAELAGKASAT